MIHNRDLVAAARAGLLLLVGALVLSACGMPTTVGADTPLEAPSTVHPEDERYEADVLRPEDEGKAPLSDFGATPPERGTATTVQATYDATVVKHYVPEPFEVAVVESRTMFVATLEEVGVTPDFNTEDGLPLKGDPSTDTVNIYPQIGHQELGFKVERSFGPTIREGDVVAVRFEISEPDFDWIDPDLVGSTVFVVAYDASYLMVDGTETHALTLIPTHTYVIDSAGLGVRLYSPTSLARYSELLAMDELASLADKVALSDLIGRTEAPSDDPAEWLGGEQPPQPDAIPDPGVEEIVP